MPACFHTLPLMDGAPGDHRSGNLQSMANILLVATVGTRAPTQIELAETFMRDGHAVRLVASANALRFLAGYLARNPSKIPLYLRHYRAALREKLAYYKAKPSEVPHIAEGKW